uniref:Uncharacterized protein n=1 Tax=Setaria digitata TaxID=48799 RepID=A0A915PH45_9BILA
MVLSLINSDDESGKYCGKVELMMLYTGISMRIEDFSEVMLSHVITVSVVYAWNCSLKTFNSVSTFHFNLLRLLKEKGRDNSRTRDRTSTMPVFGPDGRTLQKGATVTNSSPRNSTTYAP